ncbi:MAG: hypothetical protein Q7V62_07505, partial [Actinomycetota bacterium]|nr:hypothetical protein [Actinomycetota bacterium]
EEEEVVWIKVRQGEWSIDVPRQNLYIENDAEHGEWSKTSICHDTNTLDLPEGTCHTRVGFTFFFGTAMMLNEFNASWFSDARIVELLHIADFCACHDIVKRLLATVAKMDLPLQQVYDLGRRYKSDALMKRAAEAFIKGVTRADTPETVAMLVTMWPVYRERLQDPGVDVKKIRAAIQAYFDSGTTPTTMCSQACTGLCLGAATPDHVRNSLNAIHSGNFGILEHTVLERIAKALGM